MCQGQGLLEAGEGLRREPQHPEGYGSKHAAGYPRIDAHAERRSRVLVGRIAGDAFLQVQAGSRQRAEREPRDSKGIVGEDRACGVVATLRLA